MRHHSLNQGLSKLPSIMLGTGLETLHISNQYRFPQYKKGDTPLRWIHH